MTFRCGRFFALAQAHEKGQYARAGSFNAPSLPPTACGASLHILDATPDAEQFIPASNGRDDLGQLDVSVAKAINVPPGPIRLQMGYPGQGGFGLLHVNHHGDRVKQIQQLGYRDFVHFATEVAQNYERICAGSDGKLLLVLDKNGYDLCLVIRFNASFWGITTGLPKRKERAAVLHKLTRTDGSEPTPNVAGERTRFEKLTLPKK